MNEVRRRVIELRPAVILPAALQSVGIDRLAMTLLGCDAIRDVILFPQLKPKDESV